MFGETFRGKNVLVTGHTGFKGSWLCLWLSRLGANVTGIALAPDTEPSHWNLLGMTSVTSRYVDLRDADRLLDEVSSARPDIVFHLAAQPLVRRSYRQPADTFDINVMGLAHLLEAVRATDSVRVLVNVTTDKVYAERDRSGGYVETDALGGHDPYSTSKACAELVTESYRKSFLGERVRMATARAGNVIGGGDWSEDRLIPDIIRSCVSATPMRIRNPDAIRPWQHVLEPLSGYLRLAQALWSDEQDHAAWNFGPFADADLPVSRIVTAAHAAWPAFSVSIDEGDHPHEAAVLRLDSTLARDRLGWMPVWKADAAIARTVQWYRAFYETGDLHSGGDLDAYVEDATSQGLPWAA